MQIVVAGGSGLIGSALVRRIADLGHKITVLTRYPERTRPRLPATVRVASWPHREDSNLVPIEGSDVVFNLAGESIGARRWTKKQKKRIMSSRVETTRSLVDAIAQSRRRASVLVNASAVGYYGDGGEAFLTEESGPGEDFLAEVCQEWESEALRAAALGVRVVLARSGVVLSSSGGVLQRFLTPFNLFIGGPLGTGRQWLPWIHIEDEVSALVHAATNRTVTGPVNLAAPGSVTMAEFTVTLGRILRRPSWLPAPAFLLRALLGEMAGPLLLGSQRVVPVKLLKGGFVFRYAGLAEALSQLLDREGTIVSES